MRSILYGFITISALSAQVRTVPPLNSSTDGTTIYIAAPLQANLLPATTIFANTVSLPGNLLISRLQPPVTAPTLAAGATGLLTGVYYYRVSFLNVYAGETETGSVSSSVNVTTKQISLTAIPIGAAGTVARRIYRTVAGGDQNSGQMKLVSTLNDNFTTIYTDNIADGSLGATELQINMSGATLYDGAGNMLFGTSNTSTAVGEYALTNKTGARDVAVGMQTLNNNTIGTDDVSIGYQALTNNTMGSSIIAIGSSTLFNEQTAQDDTAVGQGALYSDVTGSFNTAIGQSALFSSMTDGNTAIGRFSLFDQISGASNTAIGAYAGHTSNGANGNVSGSNNTYLGFDAGPGSATQYNFQTDVGAEVNGTCSNCVVLGRTTDMVVVPGAIQSGGSNPTTTGSTCGTIGTQTGGNTNGTILTAAVTTCTLKLNFATTAPHAWNCWFGDRTHPADIPVTASSNTTSCTSNAATITAADLIQFTAFPY